MTIRRPCWSITILGMVAPLGAATITVTTTQDVIANTGSCSLREAIIAANTNAPSGGAAGECPSGNSAVTDLVVVPAGTYNLTRIGNDDTSLAGDLDVTQDLVIQGAGSGVTVLSGSAIGERVIHITGSVASVDLSGMRVSGGFSSGSGGGISSSATLVTLADVALVGNHADSDGGGLASSGSASIVASVMTGNTADDDGGGIYFSSSGQLSIVDSLIAGNQTLGGSFSDGGGVYVSNGVASLVNSAVVGNHADDSGGGLYVAGALAAAGCTFSENDADDDGGGLYFDNNDPSELENCTISGNSAVDQGGGIWVDSFDDVTLTHCTVAGNQATIGTAIANDDHLVLANSVVSGTCLAPLVVSLGGNIESPGDNCGLADPTDDVAVSAAALGLEPLSSNGGSTLTHLPSSTSAALNHGKAALCLPVDQRGVSRPLGGGCDAGAVERHPNHLFIDGFETSDLSHWSSSSP